MSLHRRSAETDTIALKHNVGILKRTPLPEISVLSDMKALLSEGTLKIPVEIEVETDHSTSDTASAEAV